MNQILTGNTDTIFPYIYLSLIFIYLPIYQLIYLLQGKKATVKKADVKSGKIYLGKLPESGCSEDDVSNLYSVFFIILNIFFLYFCTFNDFSSESHPCFCFCPLLILYVIPYLLNVLISFRIVQFLT